MLKVIWEELCHSPLLVADPFIATVHNRTTVFARWRRRVCSSNTRFLGPISLANPNGNSVRSAVFAQSMPYSSFTLHCAAPFFQIAWKIHVIVPWTQPSPQMASGSSQERSLLCTIVCTVRSRSVRCMRTCTTAGWWISWGGLRTFSCPWSRTSANNSRRMTDLRDHTSGMYDESQAIHTARPATQHRPCRCYNAVTHYNR